MEFIRRIRGVNLKNNYLKIFLIAAITSTVIFLPFVIADGGLFLFYGDYNVQQIPFYKLAHEAVRSGNIWWSFNTDIGANFIGSYSFYLLGSPFFWLTIPFPTSWVPYLMAPLFVLKFSVAAVTSYAYISRFTKSKEYAMIGALLYAFSGFAVYNIFFNHFNDVIALFPLLLIALEEFIVNRRRGVFALTVAVMACLNYFFFAGQVVFVVIYFIFRSTSYDFKYNLKQFLILAFESVLGVALAAVLLLPSVLAIIDNPRLGDFSLGWNFLTYSNVQRYLLIFQSFFFPPDIPARPNFFPDSNAKWSSVSGFLPLFGMAGVFAFFKDKSRHWLKYIFITCIVMAFIPGLNSMFYMLNSSYYARWFYMPILMMALMTVLSLENHQSSMTYGLKWSAVIVAAFTVIGIMPQEDDYGDISWFSLPPYPSRFWISVVIAVLGIVLTALMVKYFRKHAYFAKIAVLGVCIVSVLFSVTFIATGKLHSYSHEQVVDMGINAEFDLPESSTGMYRVDVYEGMDNYPMFWGMPTIQAFHSIVPASVITFYESIGIDRGVATRPDVSRYGLRGLTSVKYLFYDISEKTDPNVPGFEYYDTQNGFAILENTLYVPMGFTYDYYITYEQFENYDESQRDILLTSGVLLNDEQIEKYGIYMLPRSDESIDYLDEDSYAQNCTANAANAVTRFDETTDGFTCSITCDNPNLLYLSVPYDKGFTAYVNGVETEIESVNNGFCAVPVSAGENNIEFVYRTPGLSTGIIVSLISLVILAAYVALYVIIRRKRPEKYSSAHGLHKLYIEKTDYIPAQGAYVNSVFEKYSPEPEAKPENGEPEPEAEPEGEAESNAKGSPPENGGLSDSENQKA